MKRTFGITILGHRFSIKTADSDEHVQAISDYVTEKMAEIRTSANLPVHNLAILTALNIADELFKERERYDGLKEKIRHKSNSLLQILEQKAFGS